MKKVSMFSTLEQQQRSNSGLAVANNFDGDNNNMLIDCNSYANNILWDWAINVVSNTNNNNLENQGACPVPGQTPDPALARRNSFHNTNLTTVGSVPSLHIVNNLSATFEYRSQSDAFKPTTNVGSIISQSCFQVLQPSQCAVDNTPPDPNGLKMAINTTTDPREKISKYTDLIHARLDLNQTDQAKADLEQEARTISNKVLAATYYDEGDLLKAADYLAQIPLSDPENEEFYNLFMQLMGNNGGRMNMSALNKLAAQQNRSGSVLAQTVIAERDNVLFDKNINTPKLSTTNNTIAANSLFTLYPNPANSQVTITLSNNIAANTAVTIRITDILGKTIYNGTLNSQTIPTDKYNTGIYIVQLLSNGATIDTQRLTIVR